MEDTVDTRNMSALLEHVKIKHRNWAFAYIFRQTQFLGDLWFDLNPSDLILVQCQSWPKGTHIYMYYENRQEPPRYILGVTIMGFLMKHSLKLIH